MQTAYCLVQTAYQCALNRVLGLFFLQLLRISKLLYLFSGRESTPLRGALRGGQEPMVPILVPALGHRILAVALGGYLCVLHTS